MNNSFQINKLEAKVVGTSISSFTVSLWWLHCNRRFEGLQPFQTFGVKIIFPQKTDAESIFLLKPFPCQDGANKTNQPNQSSRSRGDRFHTHTYIQTLCYYNGDVYFSLDIELRLCNSVDIG